jgi:hypothetical protein
MALKGYEETIFALSGAEAAEAREIIACLGDRAPFGLIEGLAGAPGRARMTLPWAGRNPLLTPAGKSAAGLS